MGTYGSNTRTSKSCNLNSRNLKKSFQNLLSQYNLNLKSNTWKYLYECDMYVYMDIFFELFRLHCVYYCRCPLPIASTIVDALVLDVLAQPKVIL